MRNKFSSGILTSLAILALLLGTATAPAQSLDPTPPGEVVRLVFIHHSTGENWLRDDYGGLGRALADNNYFVSDTNYGWGPDSIGDRTDIPNWMEWFASPETPRYAEALFTESGQHADYTRTLSNPGGENVIVLFKSCFPNSALGGSPNDPPTPGLDYTVGNAKYVYNEILEYFASRPDKLFIVITAPPLSDPSQAANARAFNEWLVNDWLDENNYTQNNVAVFDFYTVLTGRDHHHHLVNGSIEHFFTPGRNTLVYPSGDDHPSEAGSRKATEEFIPLLNAFYHRWKASAPENTPADQPPASTAPPQAPAQPASGNMIEDFESGAPGWETFHDEAIAATISCAPGGAAWSGNAALQVDFNVSAGAWATCARFFDTPQDWQSQDGLSFAYRAGQAGQVFHVDLYAGSSDNRETYYYAVETTPESLNGWVTLSLAWADFHRADWEENAGQPFAKANQVQGMALGFQTPPDARNAGTIWVDAIQLFSGEAAPAPAQATQAPAQEPPVEKEPPARRILPCGSAALPLVLAALTLARKKRGR